MASVEHPAGCVSCGAAVPQQSRYCPECGARLDVPAGADTVSTYVSDERRLFGVPPQDTVFALGVAILAVAVLLLALGRLIGGLVALAVAIALLLTYLGALRHRPDGAVARLSVQALRTARAQLGVAFEAALAHGSARIELLRLGRERARLADARGEGLRTLGEAAYREDAAAVDASRNAIGELDARIAAIDERMAAVLEGARQRVRSARLRVQPTEIVSPRG